MRVLPVSPAISSSPTSPIMSLMSLARMRHLTPRGGLPNRLFDELEQLIEVERLAHNVLHAKLAQCRLVALDIGLGRDDDHGNARGVGSQLHQAQFILTREVR